MDWYREGPNWPNRHLSRFVSLANNRWHLQQDGTGPTILLLHGTGATTHSYAELIPELSKRFSVVAIDLPGHGFTSTLQRQRPSLENVCAAIAELLSSESIMPDYVVGHSAGAAIAVQMTAERMIQPRALVAINGAFFPFPGFSGQIFPAAAKLLLLNPFAPHIFAMSASNMNRLSALMDSTGSKLCNQALKHYQSALGSAQHVEGTLAMMANWDLKHMESKLRQLECPMLQIIGGQDGTVDPQLSHRSHRLLRNGTRTVFKGCGHLVHEEQPLEMCDAIASFVATMGSRPRSFQGALQ